MWALVPPGGREGKIQAVESRRLEPTDSEREASAQHRELSSVWGSVINWRGAAGLGEAQEGGDIRIFNGRSTLFYSRN